MHTNVLPLPFIALLVYGAIQVLKSIVPGMVRWPNNVTRAAGYALTYAAIIVNARVGAPQHWADLWGLLPTAAAVYGGSALLYHVQDNSAPGAAPQPAPAAPAPAAPAPAAPAPVGAWSWASTPVYPPTPTDAPVGPSVGVTGPTDQEPVPPVVP